VELVMLGTGGPLPDVRRAGPTNHRLGRPTVADAARVVVGALTLNHCVSPVGVAPDTANGRVEWLALAAAQNRIPVGN
jgi:hypothetical protein